MLILGIATESDTQQMTALIPVQLRALSGHIVALVEI